MNQIVMFAELPPGGRTKDRRTPCKRPFRVGGVQLSFELVERVERIEIRCDDQIDDDPWVKAPIVQRTVSARGAAPLTVKAPASVWDMAAMSFSVKAPAPEKRAIVRVERGDGVVRCIKVQECETIEYKEREAARRARQKPPRPGRAYLAASNALRSDKQEARFHEVRAGRP